MPERHWRRVIRFDNYHRPGQTSDQILETAYVRFYFQPMSYRRSRGIRCCVRTKQFVHEPELDGQWQTMSHNTMSYDTMGNGEMNKPADTIKHDTAMKPDAMVSNRRSYDTMGNNSMSPSIDKYPPNPHPAAILRSR